MEFKAKILHYCLCKYLSTNFSQNRLQLTLSEHRAGGILNLLLLYGKYHSYSNFGKRSSHLE